MVYVKNAHGDSMLKMVPAHQSVTCAKAGTSSMANVLTVIKVTMSKMEHVF